MIVNYVPQGWEIIFQKAHGFLAMQIASHMKPFLNERWPEILLAIAEHDDSQIGFTGRNYLNENGTPKDFTFNEFTLHQPAKVVATASYVSSFTALLISKHMTNLYAKYKDSNNEIKEFLDQQIVKQQQIISHLQVSEELIEKVYTLFHWCDRCSLILCKNQIPARERKLEVYHDIQGNISFIFGQDNLIHIDPWPFKDDKFEVYVEARLLTQLTYPDDLELKEKIDQCEIYEKKWTFKNL